MNNIEQNTRVQTNIAMSNSRMKFIENWLFAFNHLNNCSEYWAQRIREVNDAEEELHKLFYSA
jgi:hypothetical protein